MTAPFLLRLCFVALFEVHHYTQQGNKYFSNRICKPYSCHLPDCGKKKCKRNNKHKSPEYREYLSRQGFFY